ncbi:MAG: helix-turn-helix domain-containing protein [Alphaproteobacteria bacterium]|nr:helix-turn-helix domain-containing protein [Alphaproteobacteria bacterium]
MEEIIFPNQIRMHRRLHGMPMQELADHLGVSLSAISKIEKGYRRLNQEQLIQVAELLDCSLQDLYVNEQNSQQDVVQAWKREQERRSKINQTAGLKTLGAGLRHIRTSKGLTLIEVAEYADMTLSVYHRIEMGQREVSDKEYRNIAKALGTTIDKLKDSIKKLDEEGVLEDIIEHNDTRYKVLNNARYSNLGAVNSEGGADVMVPLLGSGNSEGNIVIDRNNVFREIECPSNLHNQHNIYAVNLCTRRLGSLLSSRCILFINPNEVISSGDIALYYINDTEAKLLSIREDENGQLYGVQWNPDERTNLSNSDLTRVHKVVVINL